MGIEFQYYYLSEVLNARVRFEGEGRPFGRLRDVGVVRTASFPDTVSLEVRSYRKGTVILPWSAVQQFSGRAAVFAPNPGPPPAAGFWLRRDVLDKQVVDLSGAKVRRVNDVHLLHTQGHLIPGHVEVGFVGILRRLGLERPVGGLVRWLLDYPLRDSFVSWRNVEVVSPGRLAAELRISASPDRLAGIHPAELAEILQDLGSRERRALLARLPVGAAAGALEKSEPQVQRTMMSEQAPDQAAGILQEMRAEQAAGLLRDMPGPEAQLIVGRMEKDAAAAVKLMLGHPEESAGGMMAAECVEARPGLSAAQVLASLSAQAEKADVLSLVYVLDEERRLLGVVSLRELLAAPPDAPIETRMTTQLVKVAPDAGVQQLARLFTKYGFRAIPVVNEQNVFLGAVRLRSVLAELAPFLRE